MDRTLLMTAFGYGILGLALGIHMAATENHGQLVTHAHIMLLGFVVSFVYAVMYKLWLNSAGGRLPTLQHVLHQVGTLGVVIGLYLMYGGYAAPATMGPVLGAFSVTALAGMVLMKVMLIRARQH